MTAKYVYSAAEAPKIESASDPLGHLGTLMIGYQKTENDKKEADSRMAMEIAKMVSADKRYDAEVARQSRAEEEQKRRWDITDARAADIYNREKRAYEAEQRAPSVIAAADEEIGNDASKALLNNMEGKLGTLPIYEAATNNTRATWGLQYDPKTQVVHDPLEKEKGRILSRVMNSPEGMGDFDNAVSQEAASFAQRNNLDLGEAKKLLGNAATTALEFDAPAST